MESKYENLQKQVDLLKEENRRLKEKLKGKNGNKVYKLHKKIFLCFSPVILITFFTLLGYLFNLICNTIELEKEISVIFYFKFFFSLISIITLFVFIINNYIKIKDFLKEK